jgi:hypothetical protein
VVVLAVAASLLVLPTLGPRRQAPSEIVIGTALPMSGFKNGYELYFDEGGSMYGDSSGSLFQVFTENILDNSNILINED